MNLEETVNHVIGYAKSRNEQVYEYLTKNSKSELKDLTKTDVVDSLWNFFHDYASIIETSNIDESFNTTAETHLFNLTTKQYTKVIFFKEDDEWKLNWSLKSAKENM